MKKIAIIFFLFVVSSGFSQDMDKESRKHRIPKLTVKWSPLHLLNYYPTIQVAVETKLTEKTALQLDVGPVVYGFFQPENSSAFDKKGFKAKLDFRYYIQPHNKFWKFYISPEAYVNYVDFKKEETFYVNCADGMCDYSEKITYGMRYREPGINLKLGALFHVYRFVIDFHVGGGIRFITYKPKNKPSDAMYQTWGEDDSFFLDFGPKEESRITTSPTFCVRFGYILK